MGQKASKSSKSSKAVASNDSSRFISKDAILEGLKQQEARFEFDDNYFGPDQLLFLSKQLETKSHVSLLRFTVMEGPKELEPLIAKNGCVKDWIVEVHRESDEALVHIARGVMAQQTIVSLNVSCNYVCNAETHAILVQMVRGNKTLKELHLSWQENTTQDAALALLEAAVDAGVLEKLFHSSFKMDVSGCQRMCALLKRNKSLRVVHLGAFSESLHGAAESGGLAVAELCHDSVLEDLNVVGCRFETEGVDAIAEALLHNKTLKSLRLGGPHLVHGKTFANVLLNNTSLTRLDLVMTFLNDEGVKEVAEAMKKNTTLRVLRLATTLLDKSAAEKLAEMLRTNSSLRVFHYEGDLNGFCNPMDVIPEHCDALKTIVRALVGHKTLTELNLSGSIRCMVDDKNPDFESVAAILLEGNGSLVGDKDLYPEMSKRNLEMHDKARQAVQALRVLHKRKDANLSVLPKEVAKLIGRALWDTRTEIAVWAKQK